MPVSIAEYLGQRTDISDPAIEPVSVGTLHNCPFMMDSCIKIRENNKPICSVRKKDGSLWIVCRHRLCATKKRKELSVHQKSILRSVANIIYNENVPDSEILIKREQAMKVTDRSKYHADFVMIRKSGKEINPIKTIVEMQGGGETSNTGVITKHVNVWESNTKRTNTQLSIEITSAGTLETNAWRRQQEQFIVKGNIIIQTGGRMVFCLGAPLYDYILKKMNRDELRDLRKVNWTLALITFEEDKSKPIENGPIPLRIDEEKLVFTNYNTFVDKLTNQGDPDPTIFQGAFLRLDGEEEVIE